MSQSAAIQTSRRGAATDRSPVADSPEFQKFRSVMEGVAGLVSRESVLPMLEELLNEQVQKELERLKAQPDWLRRELELHGEVQTLRLLKANWDHIGGTGYISDKFGIPRSTLHREKSTGNAIAFRPDKKSDFVFPLEQFESGGIQSWAAVVVEAVGNGAPALHFLYVARRHLDGQSFAEALRSPQGRGVPALIRKAASRLTAE